MTRNRLLLSISLVTLAGCVTPRYQSVSIEKHKGTTIVHHRRKTADGAIDHIEAISASGAYSSADVHVYDIGRYIDSSGNVHEAHRMYRVEQSAHPNLMLPKGAHSSDPRLTYTPPNYVPPPRDQRINDAVTEANKAREKLNAAEQQIQERLKRDNALKGELQIQIDENQRLRDQLNAAMTTPHPKAPPVQSDAEKAAQSSTDALAAWGKQVQQ